METGLDRFKDFVRGEQDAAFFLAGLEELKSHVAAAGDAFDVHEPWRTIPHLGAGLVAVRELRVKIAAGTLSDDARYEIEHRLAVKEEQFRHALTLAHGVGFDPIADRGEVVPGDKLEVGIRVTHQSPEPMEIRGVELDLPEGWNQSLREGNSSGRLGVNDKLEASFEVTVATDAKLSRPYWVRNQEVDRFDLIEPEFLGLPFAPPVVNARLTLRSHDAEWTVEEPVQYRYEGPWVGTEKQKRISVLPALSLNLSPRVLVYPTGASSRSKIVSVNVLYKGTDAVEASLVLEAPEGWNVKPSEAPLVFGRVGEATSVPFEVTAPEAVRPGTYTIEAVASIGDKKYREGYKTIAYHHIETRYNYLPARAEVQALELEVEPVTVGYVMGVGDDVPEAIRQLGAEVVMLDEQELAGGDLSRFDLIMTGIRAYLNRGDLRAYNHRLLSYVEGGGTVVVQYNKFEFNDAQWGPYPIRVSRDRVTVEEAPMRILEPSHPVFNFPNKITEADWEGWVQERGTYFVGERDERYRDLLASEDPWEYNAGEKRGILVEARHGKGRWLYTGLGFYRQLPAGVPDAYKFFANLLSLAKASTESSE